MIKLTWPVHARVELLLAVVVAIAVAAVGLDQIPAAVREGYAAVVTVERDRADQALVDEVLQAVVAAIDTVVP